jgi:hypothetical protein
MSSDQRVRRSARQVISTEISTIGKECVIFVYHTFFPIVEITVEITCRALRRTRWSDDIYSPSTNRLGTRFASKAPGTDSSRREVPPIRARSPSRTMMPTSPGTDQFIQNPNANNLFRPSFADPMPTGFHRGHQRG